MQFANFEEFWAALGCLYDETLEIKESIEKLRRTGEQDREAIKAQGESIHGLTEASKVLLSAVDKLHAVVDVHERRHDRTEITVEAILEDLRRHREQRPSQ
jgi:hypothetical protein